MKDTFGRDITYLRISATDRCNLRCVYCMPGGGLPLLRSRDILSYEEMALVARTAAGMGVDKVRITGGEPLVRREIEVLVSMLAKIDGIRDLAMTTNGILLARHAEALAEAGLMRVNVSLDATDPRRYRRITGGGDVAAVFEGLEAARNAGLGPVKLNCVVRQSSSESDARDVYTFGKEQGYEVRFIRLMDTSTGRFSVVEGGRGGDCPECNRLRLSAGGMVRPCLFSDLSFSVRELGPREALERAVRAKPQAGGPCRTSHIGRIGG